MHYIGWFSRSMTCGATKNHTGKPMEPDLMAGWLSRTYGQGMKTTLERSAGSADSTGYAGSAGSVGSAGAADFVGSAGSARSAGSAGSACCPSSAVSAGSAYQMYGLHKKSYTSTEISRQAGPAGCPKTANVHV